MNTLQIGLIQGNLRCFGTNCNMSRNTRFFVLFLFAEIFICAIFHAFSISVLKLLFFCLNTKKIVFPDQHFFKLTATLLTLQAGQGCCESAQVVVRQNGFSGSSLGVEMVTWKNRKSKE